MTLYRYLLVLIFTFSYSFSCALCKLQVPNVHIKVVSYVKDNKQIFDVNWQFQKAFSAETLLTYDANNDGTYQEDELDEVKYSLEVYLKKNRFLTNLTLNKEKNLDFNVIASKISYKDFKLVYDFRIEINRVLKKNNIFKIGFYDEQQFFNLIFKSIKFDNMSIAKEIKTIGSKEIYFDKKTFVAKGESSKAQTSQNDIKKEEKKSNTFYDLLRDALTFLKDYITNLLTDIKQNNTLSSYIWLLLFSFAYGIIHALGPGHGKSLVSSYFFTKDRSIFKAVNISLMIGIVHTFSAFILTFTIYYVLKSVLSQYFNDIESIAIKTSAFVIIAIAVYLLLEKLRKPKFKSFSIANNQNFVSLNPNQHMNISSCACSSCKTTSTDIGVILGAGIIPCPGTITIFIFTFGLGIYFVGFLSAIFMSLGMSFIIFLAAYLSIKVKNKTNPNGFIKKFLEYGSLIFILFLGSILLFF